MRASRVSIPVFVSWLAPATADHLAVPTVVSDVSFGRRVSFCRVPSEALQRYGLTVRNRRIALVARLLARNDQSFDRCFPDLAAKLDPYGWHRVAVLVATVEQGLELKRHLSDWPLLAAKGFAPEGLSNSQLAKLHEAPDWDLSLPAIVTPGALPEAGDFSCIVRADAGSGCPPLGDEQRLARGERPSPLLIVDFHDRHHPVLRRWTRERKMAYRSQGCDNVPIAQTLAAHQAATKRTKESPMTLSRRVLELIGVVLRGFDENSRVGIDQGGCYSPDALNLLLHVDGSASTTTKGHARRST